MALLLDIMENLSATHFTNFNLSLVDSLFPVPPKKCGIYMEYLEGTFYESRYKLKISVRAYFRNKGFQIAKQRWNL